ncbi:conserved Plasmodium protein, unknown function [Plasmodium vivax]|uniref:Uncharacterized protein n=5 Tax=Plasmodium vivax TaxID=5855 RepID=A5K1Q5_PLAVS|nr:hypothetical protein, conserved [Plasmodium vivax]KMZ85783.1 hypothetical protein PVBG_01293 [Plasmodium vivax Brazil I]KMZ92257.1 hypothetical protein PVMG_02245 [Plasmodium vivax Mauritania I]KMZ98492.1 hypothetical protein PVNG_04635 [Plasmodium vivax North Korean]EDL46355.1 hypothetical protein, conserved [Plasmodium vivax]CAG9478182.1 unnamed protein product [Plasmodium vivax]|eukprot:XP_001616082.1 hypothetical protein [Plasmodium vivax Sal-1]
MNNSSTVASNESPQFQKPVVYKNRARSIMNQSVRNGSESQQTEQGNGTSIRDKIRRLFSSKHDQTIRDLQKTKLTANKSIQEQEPSERSVHEFVPTHQQNVEWQPVYRETCKIKLPVDESVTKIALPEEVLHDWVDSQKKVAQQLGRRQKGEDVQEDEDQEDNSQGEDLPELGSNCLFRKNGSKKSCRLNSAKDQYSKFKYYYNYYLVDEYLESLAVSQNKSLDATGLDEHGQLYDNVSLNVKPIIVSKQRLENGVPYDPSKLLQ